MRKHSFSSYSTYIATSLMQKLNRIDEEAKGIDSDADPKIVIMQFEKNVENFIDEHIRINRIINKEVVDAAERNWEGRFVYAIGNSSVV